jgi:hypothetical protein
MIETPTASIRFVTGSDVKLGLQVAIDFDTYLQRDRGVWASILVRDFPITLTSLPPRSLTVDEQRVFHGALVSSVTVLSRGRLIQ